MELLLLTISAAGTRSFSAVGFPSPSTLASPLISEAVTVQSSLFDVPSISIWLSLERVKFCPAATWGRMATAAASMSRAIRILPVIDFIAFRQESIPAANRLFHGARGYRARQINFGAVSLNNLSLRATGGKFSTRGVKFYVAVEKEALLE